MNKNIGLLLIGLSLLTSAIVVSLAHIAQTVAAASKGFASIRPLTSEIPGYAYLAVTAALFIGFYLFRKERQ